MADANYRVIQQDDGSFVTSIGALPQLAAGFATAAAANIWIAQDKRLWDAVPFRTPACRRRQDSERIEDHGLIRPWR